MRQATTGNSPPRPARPSPTREPEPATEPSDVTQIRDALDRHLWTLQRFGLSASKAPSRMRPAGAPRVLCVSIPKAGTHLLERALCLHPRLYRKVVPTVTDDKLRRYGGLDGLLARVKPGQVIVSHLRFQPGYPEIIAGRARAI